MSSIGNISPAKIEASSGLFGKVRGFFANMNAIESVVLDQAGKSASHEVPNGLGSIFKWGFRPFDASKDTIIKKIFSPIVTASFKLLQLPIVRSVSPFMKYNLLFGAALGAISAGYSFVKGDIGNAIHKVVGNTIALGTTAAAAFAVPSLLGISAVGGAAAWIGFGIQSFLEPKVRKFVGLDKDPPPNEQDAAQAQMLQHMMAQGGHPPGFSPQVNPVVGTGVMNPYAAQATPYQLANSYNPYQAYAAQQQAAYLPYAGQQQYPQQWAANPINEYVQQLQAQQLQAQQQAAAQQQALAMQQQQAAQAQQSFSQQQEAQQEAKTLALLNTVQQGMAAHKQG